MAQFIDKIDYFGLADSTMLVCKSSDDGKTADLAEVNGEDGSIIEGFTYAERLSPSNEYTMVADWTK